MKYSLRLFILYITISVSFSSCLNDTSHIYITNTSNILWDKNKPLYTYFENKDTTTINELSIIARQADTYIYDRLILSVEFLSPSGIFWRETLYIPARKNHDILSPLTYNDIEVKYRSKVQFKEIGTYRLRFSHLMLDSTLSGIAGIGLKIKH